MSAGARVDWSMEGARPDPVYGAGATATEKNLARAAGAGGALLVAGHAFLGAPESWSWWQYGLAAVLAFDLIGGVVANGLNSAKRSHFAQDPAPAGLLGELVRRPVLFAAVHIQPILVGLLFPGAAWWWGLVWYLCSLLAVALVRVSPLYLQRPVALAVCAGVAVIAPMVTSPLGFAWLPVVMALKLVLAHAVQEEPYRPATEPR